MCDLVGSETIVFICVLFGVVYLNYVVYILGLHLCGTSCICLFVGVVGVGGGRNVGYLLWGGGLVGLGCWGVWFVFVVWCFILRGRVGGCMIVSCLFYFVYGVAV